MGSKSNFVCFQKKRETINMVILLGISEELVFLLYRSWCFCCIGFNFQDMSLLHGISEELMFLLYRVSFSGSWFNFGTGCIPEYFKNPGIFRINIFVDFNGKYAFISFKSHENKLFYMNLTLFFIKHL